MTVFLLRNHSLRRSIHHLSARRVAVPPNGFYLLLREQRFPHATHQTQILVVDVVSERHSSIIRSTAPSFTSSYFPLPFASDHVSHPNIIVFNAVVLKHRFVTRDFESIDGALDFTSYGSLSTWVSG